MEKKCISCGVDPEVFAEFFCPECGATIIRCKHCKALNNQYKCAKCGFEGP